MSLPTIVFITALPCEFNAVVKHIENKENKFADRHYAIGSYGKWQVVVYLQNEPGNDEALLATKSAIQENKPHYLFFVGVAGGIKDVKIGDVVIANKITDYDPGKIKDNQFEARPDTLKPHKRLIALANHTISEEKWFIKLDRLPPPTARVSPIISGKKVIVSRKFLKQLRGFAGDAVAAEMEGMGFLRAIVDSEKGSGLVIRGISDLCDPIDKNEESDKKWQPIAAENAAAFAFAMLDELKPSPPEEIDKNTPDDAVKSPSSLIFKLDQVDRNVDAYRLQVWFNDTVIHTSENHQRKNLPSVIDSILHDKILPKHAVCRDEFTIEFFLPKNLLFEPIDQWLLDADLGETLGSGYKLVIRSSERFESKKAFNLLNDYWCRLKKRIPNFLQNHPKQMIYNIPKGEVVGIQTELEDGKLLFILNFMSDQDFLYTLIKHGVPLLLWTRKNPTCDEEIKEFDNLLFCCATLEQLPEKLRKERLRIVEHELDQSRMTFNLSLLWDDPNKIPPFSKLSHPTQL